MNRPKVHMTGGDGTGWALDEDLRLTRQALSDIVEFSDLDHCEVIHSVWWESLLRVPEAIAVRAFVVCHMSGEPFRYLTLPQHRHVVGLVDCWIAQTAEAARQCRAVGLPHIVVPYTTDVAKFHPISAGDTVLGELGRTWRLPTDRYLLGNFHRDSAGFDLSIPKRTKGPDIFCEIVRGLHREGHAVHAVLAGPRRHWVRKRFAEWGVPYTFVGQLMEEDDYQTNMLPQQVLNQLYNLLDLCVVSSRSEGGPRTLMEAAAARRKVISTPVGLAPDLLDPSCLYRTPVEAVGMIRRDIQTNYLSGTVDTHYRNVLTRHRPEAVAALFRDIYDRIGKGAMARKPKWTSGDAAPPPRPPAGVIRRVLKAWRGHTLKVCLWHRFFAPPYGGGNQFMLALRKALRRRGVCVVENQLRDDIDVYLLNSVHFDVEQFLEFSRRRPLRAVHRIDGPIHLIRGFDREKDELCFDLNARFASSTVLQSTWTYQRIAEMSYKPVKPVIIQNTVDPDIFHRRGRVPFDGSRKIRLIATSWSNNARKGGPVYKWLERHLDWDRFDFTFVGNASEPFERIRSLPAVPSEQLGALLRQHDVYLTASQNDPCSNAVIEALACGLPVLYRNDGGHPELVGSGGLPFSEPEEIISQLDVMASNYEVFQRLIVVPTMDEVADKYLTLLKEAAG
ncbi:Glycosyltransferase [Nitrospira japonica]|uniref:Glycosyltransferase n=1 Tax=Nitrospira japonica TaxID=1325564 RepID=A0A1W1I0A6_9BACT|nr:glycosyltransferase [Nitrospira japonica]SLM46421.1 Glycosyltransferase [Nitrospira japonica]